MVDSAAVHPARRNLAVVAATILGIAVTLAGAGPAASSTDPSVQPSEPATTAVTTSAPRELVDGVFTDPAGTFSVRFAAVPTALADPAAGAVSYLLNVDEDSQTVSTFGLTAFGAAESATATERVELFLSAAGAGPEQLANAPTRLGPFHAAYYIANVTLSTGTDAVLYGVTVVRDHDVTYVFYTDVGGDDSEVGREFVESFTVLMSPPPQPTTTTVPTTVTATGPASHAPTTTAVPDGATVSFDGRWWILFPDDAGILFRASSDNGFAYAEYLAVVGDDTLIVRVTELPPGFERAADGVADDEAERIGGAVLESTDVDVDGHPGVRFTLAQDDSDASGDTVDVLVVNRGDQLYRVTFEDGGQSSPDDAAEFIDSFHFT